ncbi:Histidyl-tRNA synthetase [Rhodovulum sp. PH10]|uniref:histidine--tRNA ligase n=1 Tax=Rhodovulum sp. PH10 TaxID=1187851 RepID=UPI00027C2EA5|nr:histidine--tRNA ligase [Rhodovulum sp. PH10]EJW10406.1 Histidyl-tRNA synthetase [Rhodovulum sp. PH10]
MATDKKSKLKARLPRGLVDRGPGEIAATQAMIDKIRAVYELYGFEPVETPAIEYTDALGKFLPDQDRPNEGVFSFQDDDEQWLSLRYDLTAPLARHVAENFQNIALPYRSYRFGFVFRNEKPGPGRFRQFMQFDADTVGSASPAADAEICMMAADTMEALGIPRGSYVVKVNNRKVLDGVLEAIGLGGAENAGRRLTVLRAIDKLDRLCIEGVRLLLGEGRKDESGDFTKGAGLGADDIDAVINSIAPTAASSAATSPTSSLKAESASFSVSGGEAILRGPEADILGYISNRRQYFPDSKAYQTGLEELAQIAALCVSSGYDQDRIRVDPTVVRGLEYYTGPVFEVELLLDTKDEKGRPVRFGSVGGGGRYDGLVSRFRGEPVPATGFSIGVSRLQAALALIGEIDTTPAPGPVVVTVFDKARLADYQAMAATLRKAGIRAELYLGNPKNMGNQLKYADRRRSPCVVIQGSNEKDHASGTPHVIVKDLLLGAELAKLDKDREDYLARQEEAQALVPEADLVAAVRKVLQRHGIG